MYNFVTSTILLLSILTAIVLAFFGKITIFVLAIFLFLCAGALLVTRFRRHAIFKKYRGDREEAQEMLNLSGKSIEEKRSIFQILPTKLKKATFLFNVSEKLLGLTTQDEVFDFLANTCAELFAHADNILVFSFKQTNESLELVRSLKRAGIAIKEKKGEIIDRWVLRHNQSLLIEDLTKDFRFDYTKTVAFKERGIHSVIAHPIAIREKLMGVVRVESKSVQNFSLDDSRILSSICDLSAVVLERVTLISAAQELAIKDSLTALYVKDFFYKRLDEELSRARMSNTKIGIAMLDIDDFKKINDTHGHIVGDIVLKRLARILIETIGDSGNLIARFGGEEFIFFVIKSEKQQLLDMAELIRKTVSESVIHFRRKNTSFTVSIGALMFPDDAQDAMALVEKADQLLYKAKKAGKNQVCAG